MNNEAIRNRRRRFEEAIRDNGYVQSWGISDVELEELNNSSGGIVLKAAEDKVISSIWSAFMSVANTGMSVVANKISHMFNGAFSVNTGSNENVGDNSVNYNTPFLPFEVNTGLKVKMEENEILTVYNANEAIGKGLIILNTQVFRDGENIKIKLYNIFPREMVIRRGDIIGVAYFSNIISLNASGCDNSAFNSNNNFVNNAVNMQYTNEIKSEALKHTVDRKGIDLKK